MKKLAFILLMFFILATLVFLGFSFITQNGLFAVAAYYVNSEGVSVQIDRELLTNALKTRDSDTELPEHGNFTGTLKVSYRTDMTMSYKVIYNPFTNEGFIEKGLLKKKLYKMPGDSLGVLINVTTSDLSGHNYTIDFPLDSPVTDIINHNDTKLLNPFVSGGHDLRAFTITETMSSGDVINGKLLVDIDDLKIFFRTDELFYEFPEMFTEKLFSTYPIDSLYEDQYQKMPEISLMTEADIEPSSYSYEWMRIKPDGSISESQKSDVPDSEIFITPGTGITVSSGIQVPDSVSIEEYHDGILFDTYHGTDASFTVPYYNGELKYVLTSVYSKDSYPDSYGTITAEYIYDMDFPTQAVSLYDEVRPGDILAYRIDFADEGESFSIVTNLRDYKADFTPYDNSLVVFVPVYWWTSPGEYYAKVYREYEGKKELFEEYAVTILPDDFITEYQYLEVSEELKEKTDPVKTANDGVIVREAKSNPSPTTYIDGTFIMPIDGELGTSYAMTRYINGENPYRHSGLDIDGEMGDPIVACNNGVIVYAGPLVRPGNTVIIDHGMGLFTSYLHLSGFAVEEGDYVEKGDVVAYIGSTGFSTGPHLHWSVTLGGTYMSPLWLVENPLVP